MLGMKRVLPILLVPFVLFAFTHYSSAQKEKKIYPLGKRIYAHVCKEVQREQFTSLKSLYNYIHSHCNLNQKRYEEALALYIWEQSMHQEKNSVSFEYTKASKCPVCGMFVYKYPQWVTLIVTSSGEKLYFDGVKDMLKYYFSKSPKKRASMQLFVQDYYTKRIIDARGAFFVAGSDIYGPMGEELIPFFAHSSAQKFLKDHQAKSVYGFAMLHQEQVWSLDE